MSKIIRFQDLLAYQKAYALDMDIFEHTKSFPKEERFALTDQIRRSSRAITSNLAEAWAKKAYIKYFINKLSDSLGEEFETEVWLDYSKDCNYISADTHDQLIERYIEVRRLLIYMIQSPEKFHHHS